MGKNILILNEKPSAARNFSKALGGFHGEFNGNHYDLVAAHGHLVQLVSPQDMVTKQEEQKSFSDWNNLAFMPWPLDRLNWKTAAIKGSGKTLNEIKTAAKGHDVIVIATDDDPSGEGDVLGWEIVNYIGWTGEVWRIRFADELPKSIKAALQQPEIATNQMQQPKYIKGLTRQRFDYATGLQETRLTTATAHRTNYNFKSVLNVGRLKTVIINAVARQNKLRKNWVKHPFYEVRFKDNNGNVFTRKNPNNDFWRFDDEVAAKNDLSNYQSPDKIVIDSKEEKRTEPPKLINLATLGALIQKRDFKTKEILNTYQKMYNDQVVSYPRTEDTRVTSDQFNELLPLAPKIAKLVGVEPSLLTHSKARSKFLTQKADHGANRPGEKVPDSLEEIKQKYGQCGVAIYEQLAKSYLAILCEDYIYEQTKAHLANHSDFKTTVNIPKSLNYKEIFDEKVLEENEKTSENSKGLTDHATSFVYQGSNTPPAKPNLNFLRKFLEQNSVGTGATRLSTIAELSEGSNTQLKIIKGVYQLTARGILVAALTHNTWIGEVKITKRLQDLMKEVEAGKTNYNRIIQIASQIISHDKPTILSNAENIKNDLEVKKEAQELEAKPVEKFFGTFTKTDEKVEVPVEIYDGHKTTSEQQKEALAGQTITYQVTNKYDKEETHEAYLGTYDYKDKQYFGWIVKRESLNFIFTDGKQYSIPVERSGHHWNQDEVNLLSQGKSVTCTNLIGKKGRYIAKLTFNPKNKYLFDMEFVNTRHKLDFKFKDGKTYQIYPKYFEHEWKQSELEELAMGNSVVIKLKAKSGKIYSAKLTFNPKNKYLFDREYVR